VDFEKKYLRGKKLAVLDLGCGNGRNAIYLIEKGYKVTAVDFVDNSFKESAKKHPEIDYRIMDIGKSWEDIQFLLLGWTYLTNPHHPSKRLLKKNNHPLR